MDKTEMHFYCALAGYNLRLTENDLVIAEPAEDISGTLTLEFSLEDVNAVKAGRTLEVICPHVGATIYVRELILEDNRKVVAADCYVCDFWANTSFDDNQENDE